MNTAAHFDVFAQTFVRKYWETVKSGVFPMPGDEPVEETLEQLLSRISHQTGLSQSNGANDLIYELRMCDVLGSWWIFSFRETDHGWVLLASSARSDDDDNPHDLLGPIYREHFEPFLRAVTKIANGQSGIIP